MMNRFYEVQKLIEEKYTKEEREVMKVLAKRDSQKLDAKLSAYRLERKLRGGIR